jgi:glutathione S-transferase
VNRDKTIVPRNPLGKVPTLITDDGKALYDSRVICEYLASLGGSNSIFPAEGSARWQALVDQALGDGLLDAALLARYEGMLRPEPNRFQPWLAGQMEKIGSCLDVIEAECEGYGERVDIGTITIGCALGYLDFRFADLDWRRDHPKAARWFETFSARPSMAATAPFDAAKK